MIRNVLPLILITVVLVAAACRTNRTGVNRGVELQPSEGSLKKDTFFEKTRLIMTKEESEIYKHLPDKASKEKFVREFWEDKS